MLLKNRKEYVLTKADIHHSIKNIYYFLSSVTTTSSMTANFFFLSSSFFEFSELVHFFVISDASQIYNNNIEYSKTLGLFLIQEYFLSKMGNKALLQVQRPRLHNVQLKVAQSSARHMIWKEILSYLPFGQPSLWLVRSVSEQTHQAADFLPVFLLFFKQQGIHCPVKALLI